MSDTEVKDDWMSGYIAKRRRLRGFMFETALPNEYLVDLGRRQAAPVLGGRRFRLFRKFLRVPACVQTLYFQTDNANVDYQGIGLQGYASWRIDPANPGVAIATLDFFDDEDPMARTNAELRTICVEAVRHVIANMSIEDALRKKDEIAENLLGQLRGVEKKWGILFDHVGIEQVRIMSKTVFENLQADYRNSLRLSVERKRIDTDRQVATEENSLLEGTETERIETERRLGLSRIEGQASVSEADSEEKHKLRVKDAERGADEYRREAALREEKGRREHELETQRATLEMELREVEAALLQRVAEVERLKAGIARTGLEVEREKRAVQNEYTPEALHAMLLERLPEIYGALKIDDYQVLATGPDSSPLARVFAEVLALLRQAGIAPPGDGGSILGTGRQ